MRTTKVSVSRSTASSSSGGYDKFDYGFVFSKDIRDWQGSRIKNHRVKNMEKRKRKDETD
jgi:hypothetical protein